MDRFTKKDRETYVRLLPLLEKGGLVLRKTENNHVNLGAAPLLVLAKLLNDEGLVP